MRLALPALCLLALGFLAGCEDASGPNAAPQPPPGGTLTVIAGSELKDIEPLLPLVEMATGVRLEMSYMGTLDAVERIQAGATADAAWLASNRYAMLVPEVRSRVAASERTMITPVVLGIKESKARELGWINNPDVTWKTIADAAAAGKFTFGMTNPASSNTGFSGLLGLAAALSGKGDALEEGDIDGKQLAGFFASQRLTSGSSGWLADAFLADQDKVDGIINYASTLLQLNRDPQMREKLVLIYPRDGLLSSDYPLMLLNPAKRDAFAKVVEFIRGSAFQTAMTKSTLRRPVNPDVPSEDPSPSDIAELPFPGTQAVVDAILTAFEDELRLPTDSTFVLDVSGSMEGDRLQALKNSMGGLAGGDSSTSGRFSRFRARERVFLLPFSNLIQEPEKFEMSADAAANTRTLQAITGRVNQLEAKGGTAMFSATQAAYLAAAARRRSEPNRFYSVVLLTDGQSNNGMDAAEFSRWYAALPAADKGIRVFPVVFGAADTDQLRLVARLTSGKVFDGRKSDLRGIFKEIRGYQ